MVLGASDGVGAEELGVSDGVADGGGLSSSSHTGAVLVSSTENFSPSLAFTTSRRVSSLSCFGSSIFLWNSFWNVSVGSRSLPSAVIVTVFSDLAP